MQLMKLCDIVKTVREGSVSLLTATNFKGGKNKL